MPEKNKFKILHKFLLSLYTMYTSPPQNGCSEYDKTTFSKWATNSGTFGNAKKSPFHRYFRLTVSLAVKTIRTPSMCQRDQVKNVCIRLE